MNRADLLAYDDSPTQRGDYERFLCPKCGDEHAQDQMHQSLSLKDNYYLCHRCGERGVLEGHGRHTAKATPKTTHEIMADRFKI